MESEKDTSEQNFKIDKSQSLNGILLTYLDSKLPNFPAYFKRKTSIKRLEAETKISQELCVFLNWDSMFLFQPEWKYEDSSRSSDVGVIDVEANYNSSEPTQAFFTIEAKRLPTTGTDKKTKKSRKKEYVEGNLGGIERYKRGQHGADLPQSAIIGYVQKENCSYWHTKINEWINELIKKNKDKNIHWDTSDLIFETHNFGNTRKYLSENSRILNSKKDSIEIYHYLLELN